MYEMTKILAIAMKKVAGLPAELQEDLSYEIIDRVAAWHELREKIAEGIRSLDAGEGRTLTKRELLKEFRKRHGKKK